jgi:uncharacterized protein YndB with AHSA1/START domain
MESVTEGLVVRREIEIAASPETVWELLADPAKAQTWWGQDVTLEPHPGGAVRIVVTPRSVVRGEVLEFDPPRRLVYTFGWEVGGGGPEQMPPGSSTVEIELAASGTGTTLRLVHRGLNGAEALSAHGEGWTHYLGRLEVVAGGGDPGPDPWAAESGT